MSHIVSVEIDIHFANCMLCRMGTLYHGVKLVGQEMDLHQLETPVPLPGAGMAASTTQQLSILA